MSPLVPVQPVPGQRRPGTRAEGSVPAGALRLVESLTITAAEAGGWLGSFIWGPDGDVTCSPATRSLLDVPPEALTDVLAGVLTPILCDGAGRGWDVYELETDVDGSDGVLRRVRVRAAHVPDAPGWLAGVLEPIGTHTADVADRYQLLLELSPDALIVHDAGTIVYANPAAVAFARAEDLDSLVGRPMLSFVAPESQPELLRRLAGLTEPGAVSEPSEAILLRLDGTTLFMEAVSVRTSWNGKPAFQVIMRDLTERRAAEAVVRQQASLVEHVSDAIVAVDTAGTLVTWNPAAERVFGHRAEDVRGRLIQEVLGDDLAAVECCNVAGPQRLESRLSRADGRVIDVEVAIDPIRDGSGACTGQVMICTDVTERRQIETERRVHEARLLHQSRHDVLTGLANRAMVLEHLTALLAEGADAAVLFLDLDRFKLINDSLGHAAGDEVLRIVARRLGAAVRGADLVGRLAGDEFVVLVGGNGRAPGGSGRGSDRPAELTSLVDRLFAALTEPLSVNGRQITVTASIGVSRFEGTGTAAADAEDLLRDADVAMYTAKQTGRSQAVWFDAQLRSQALHSLELEEDLRRAVADGSISVVYQPLVELASGRVTGTEALARWQHPTRGAMSPALFVPVAEETGLIGRMGISVLADACSQTAAWRADGFTSMRVAVNLSGRQLADPSLVPDVVATLAATGLPSAALSLEITESVLMTDPDAAARTLAALADIGVGLSVDDFGTGYSSLSYLRQFPVDTIKIDRSFVADITHDMADLAIVDSVIGLAHRLNLRTVAEGAETEEQVTVLRELGCHQVQGYWFSRPLLPEAIPGFTLSR